VLFELVDLGLELVRHFSGLVLAHAHLLPHASARHTWIQGARRG
jgi:hypothetical protein